MTGGSGLSAPGFPEAAVRERARSGTAAAFPPLSGYGHTLLGAAPGAPEAGAPYGTPGELLETGRLVPPVFMPRRLEKLIELGREPQHSDVDLTTDIGGFQAPLPLYVSAFGSTRAAGDGLGTAVGRQAGSLGLPLVIGENVLPVSGYGRPGTASDGGGNAAGLLRRIRAYADELPDGVGGIAVQQSTEDADAEVWNLVHSDPHVQPLLASGRLAFELKVGQGAKPGLGGMTLVDAAEADRLADRYRVQDTLGEKGDVLRCSAPGTVTEEILRQQIRFMRSNYPRVRVWVKLFPGRDVDRAAAVAWQAGADAVTVDGAEGGSGWAPHAFLDGVGLPLGECLRRIAAGPHPLLVSGRMWEGGRVARSLALGARAAGLGRAALLAADEDPDRGLIRLTACLELELRLLVSALGKYAAAELAPEDLWPQPAAERRPDPTTREPS
ncbi:glutamate synthase-related protein [Streptomyces lydicus]|uniref:Ferredoxin-dependent glutamate synthase n=1 Tax=Streptomyces lydicus TaxID=47763 RepID=D1GLU4_9ACTN|nr:glutamate synthase-related protein [Streptomyces lydicus]UEG90320.1 alpha-hydroxy-acid oxidizing protein [Streptomyces lydicus]CBA11569.1 ferredoxin-dependent glutamate synthase [Streptomyces lydicus]